MRSQIQILMVDLVNGDVKEVMITGKSGKLNRKKLQRILEREELQVVPQVLLDDLLADYRKFISSKMGDDDERLILDEALNLPGDFGYRHLTGEVLRSTFEDPESGELKFPKEEWGDQVSVRQRAALWYLQCRDALERRIRSVKDRREAAERAADELIALGSEA